MSVRVETDSFRALPGIPEKHIVKLYDSHLSTAPSRIEFTGANAEALAAEYAALKRKAFEGIAWLRPSIAASPACGGSTELGAIRSSRYQPGPSAPLALR